MGARSGDPKGCYCRTCERAFHALGINRHRAMHRDRREDCVIEYTHGDVYAHRFSRLSPAPEPAQ